MEKIVEQNLLYDFYGELLNEHQRKIYEDAVYGDLSLSELAEEYGITRQAVHDVIKRCDKILEGYEAKLKLLDKFKKTKKYAGQIRAAAEKALEDNGQAMQGEGIQNALVEIKELSEQIMKVL